MLAHALALILAIDAADAGTPTVVDVERAELKETETGQTLFVVGGCWLNDSVCREVGRKVKVADAPTLDFSFWWFTVSFVLGVAVGGVGIWLLTH